MSTISKRVIKLSIGLLILFGGYNIVEFIIYTHSVDSRGSTYLFTFKDSIKNNVDTIFFFGQSRRSDLYYDYYYKENTKVMIFEYNELKNSNLNDIRFITNEKLSVDAFVDDFYGEKFNENAYPLPDTYINFGLNFEHGMTVYIDKESVIKKRFEGKNYRGFFGNITKIAFSNSDGQKVVFFDYKLYANPTLFVLRNYHGRYIVIMINSEDNLEPSIINILNLEG